MNGVERSADGKFRPAQFGLAAQSRQGLNMNSRGRQPSVCSTPIRSTPAASNGPLGRPRRLHLRLVTFGLSKADAPAPAPRCAQFRLQATFIFAALSVFLLASGCGPSGKVETGPYLALGEVAAKATSNVLGGRGNVVLLINESDDASSTALGQAIKVFKQTLEKSGVKVSVVEKLADAKSGPIVSGVDPLQPQKFLELIARHSSADALVSFVGVPRLSLEQIAQLPAQRPKIIAAMTFNPPSRALFEQHVLVLAIVPQAAGTTGGQPPQTTQEWFDANYQMITPENASGLPL
jgi:hypothetical protein